MAARAFLDQGGATFLSRVPARRDSVAGLEPAPRRPASDPAEPPAARALLAYLVFNTAEWATWVAILVWAFGEGGASASGLIAIIQLVPAALVAPLGSVLGDRMRRSRALALGYALQAVTCWPRPRSWRPSPRSRRGGHRRVGGLGRDADPARAPRDRAGHRAQPRRADGRELGLDHRRGDRRLLRPGGERSLLAAAGPPRSTRSWACCRRVGSAHRRSGRPRRRSPLRPRASARPRRSGVPGDQGDAGAALLVGMVAAQYVVVGMLDILAVVLALEVLGMADSGPGLLTSSIGIGAILGGAASVSLVGRQTARERAWRSPSCVTGTPRRGHRRRRRPWWAVVLLAAYGAGHAYFDVAGRTLLQRTTRPDVLSRIFGHPGGAHDAGSPSGSCSPARRRSLRPTRAFLVTGLFLPILGLLAWVRIREA